MITDQMTGLEMSDDEYQALCAWREREGIVYMRGNDVHWATILKSMLTQSKPHTPRDGTPGDSIGESAMPASSTKNKGGEG